MKFYLNFKRPLKNLNSFFLQNIIMNYYIFIIIYYEVAYIKVISAIYFCVNTFLEEPEDFNNYYDDTKKEYFPKINKEGDFEL